MSVYTTRIAAKKSEAPILLGNGNPIEYYQMGLVINPTSTSSFPLPASNTIYKTTTDLVLASGFGNYVPDEIVYQGANLAYSTAQALVYSVNANSDMQVYRTIGTFASGTVKGNTSGAIWTISTSDDLANMDNVFEDIQDNNRIESESDGIIDFTEINPFGEP